MRQPKPFFRKQTQSWYVQLPDRQYNLGKDKESAWKAYYKLMADYEPPAPTMPVVQLIDRFLADLDKNAKARRTYDWYKRHLNSFKAFLEARYNGKTTIDKLTSEHVNGWLSECYKSSGDNNKLGAVRAVARVCNWAVYELRIIPSNPIARMKRPSYTPRECYVEPADWAKFLAAVKPGPFRDIVQFLRLTGCRPNEACIAEVRHFDRERRCLVFERSESKGKKKKRIIPLVGEAFEIVRRLALIAGDGPIFRTQRGAVWSNSSLNSCCDNIERRTGVKLSPYVIRFTFITDKLTAGIDPVTLAKIVGHADIKMIHMVYAQLDLKSDYLRECSNEQT